MYDAQTIALRLRTRSIIPPKAMIGRLPPFVGVAITEIAWVSRNAWPNGDCDITTGYCRAETLDEERDLLRYLPWVGAPTITLGSDPDGDVRLIRYRLLALLHGEPHGQHKLMAIPGEKPIGAMPAFWDLPVGETRREDALIATGSMLARYALAESKDGLALDRLTPVLAEMRAAATREPRDQCLADVAEAAVLTDAGLGLR